MRLGRRCQSLVCLLCLFVAAAAATAGGLEQKPIDPYFEAYQPAKAPESKSLLLKKGDRLAVVGDSITEQRMYSRLIETYLTVCVPELEITTRQFGWSGETAEGFRMRMTNDCLSFKPTVVTTSFGMNDYKYRPYDEANAQWYRSNYTAMVEIFKSTGARVVLGSPSCVGKVANWVKSASGTLDQHNQHLCQLRNIGVEIASAEHVRFADNFWPMLTAGFDARRQFGPDYAIAGKDGVHPGWAGHLLMARAYLKVMGLNGDLGTITLYLNNHGATATRGHSIQGFTNGQWTVLSTRYPFCATGETNNDNSLRSGMTLVPFNEELNRLTLVVKGTKPGRYKVVWGAQTRVYSAEQLNHGINLAAEFEINPFSEAFARVDKAVAEKQAYETHQIKDLFHSKEARDNMDAVFFKSETERAPLAEAVRKAFQPVTHTLRIDPE